jgi:3-dehydroquinate dehydratase
LQKNHESELFDVITKRLIRWLFQVILNADGFAMLSVRALT